MLNSDDQGLMMDSINNDKFEFDSESTTNCKKYKEKLLNNGRLGNSADKQVK